MSQMPMFVSPLPEERQAAQFRLILLDFFRWSSRGLRFLGALAGFLRHVRFCPFGNFWQHTRLQPTCPACDFIYSLDTFDS
jgi:hypothetical protein